MEKLYDLEYKVAQLRKQYVNMVKYDNLTLEEVVKLGFNNVIINGFRLYIDEYDEIVIYNYHNGYNLNDKKVLNSKVEYKDFEIVDDEIGNYLEIYVKFTDETMNSRLNEIVEFVGDDESE